MSTEHEQTPPAAPAAAKKRKPLLIAVAAIVLVAGAGVGAAMWMGGDHTPAEQPAPERGIVAFEPFVANLSDSDAARYLRITVHLVVSSVEAADEVEHSPVALMRARSAILELLTTQTSGALVTAQGKQTLRQSIVERVGKTLAPIEVVDVLFSDFVVQF